MGSAFCVSGGCGDGRIPTKGTYAAFWQVGQGVVLLHWPRTYDRRIQSTMDTACRCGRNSNNSFCRPEEMSDRLLVLAAKIAFLAFSYGILAYVAYGLAFDGGFVQLMESYEMFPVLMWPVTVVGVYTFTKWVQERLSA